MKPLVLQPRHLGYVQCAASVCVNWSCSLDWVIMTRLLQQAQTARFAGNWAAQIHTIFNAYTARQHGFSDPPNRQRIAEFHCLKLRLIHLPVPVLLVVRVPLLGGHHIYGECGTTKSAPASITVFSLNHNVHVQLGVGILYNTMVQIKLWRFLKRIPFASCQTTYISQWNFA